MVLEIIIGIFSILILVLSYTTWNQFRKVERLEDWVESFSSKIIETQDVITELDSEGRFKADDEIGVVFDAIKQTFGLNESEVISLMRKHLRISSFKLWRKRVSGRKTKHEAKRNFLLGRFKCSRQRNINQNKISKRNGINRKSVRIRK